MAEESDLKLNKKDKKKRELILTGSIWKSVVLVCFPMALYQLINQMFRVFDMYITSHISTTAVSAVSFFNQLSNTFSSFDGGLAIGAGIIIAGYYGAGKYAKVKEAVSSVFAFVILVAGGLAAILIAFSPVVMKLANTPDDLKEMGYKYYIVMMVNLVFMAINSIYICIEKSKGNGRMILIVNFVLTVVKVILSSFFVFYLKMGITMVAVATLLANATVSLIAIIRLSKKGDIFGFSFKCVSLRWRTLKEIVIISLPVMAEKFSFSFGKVMVNSIGVFYGTNTVGALGVSNNMSAISTVPPTSIGDGGSAIIRQNTGAGNNNRVIPVFRTVLIINILYSLIGLIITWVFLDPLTSAFSNKDEVFRQLAKSIYSVEMISNVFLAVHASVMALLYGLGYTKLSFLINFSRLFIFRLPVLLFLRYFTALDGATVMGLVMMISNALTSLLAAIIGAVIINKEFGINGFKDLFRIRRKNKDILKEC